METVGLEKANCPITHRVLVGIELSKVVRARYEGGVLKLLEPVDLREGEEVIVRLETYEDRLRRLRKYRGILGKASKEEIEELLLEAEFEKL